MVYICVCFIWTRQLKYIMVHSVGSRILFSNTTEFYFNIKSCFNTNCYCTIAESSISYKSLFSWFVAQEHLLLWPKCKNHYFMEVQCDFIQAIYFYAPLSHLNWSKGTASAYTLYHILHWFWNVNKILCGLLIFEDLKFEDCLILVLNQKFHENSFKGSKICFRRCGNKFSTIVARWVIYVF